MSDEPAEAMDEDLAMLEEYRAFYADQFRDLKRQVSDLLGGMPGSSRGPSREHQLLGRRFGSFVATFNGLLASPLTPERWNGSATCT